MAAADHPHIVPIHEVGEHEGRVPFAMRYIEGRLCARLSVNRRGPRWPACLTSRGRSTLRTNGGYCIAI